MSRRKSSEKSDRGTGTSVPESSRGPEEATGSTESLDQEIVEVYRENAEALFRYALVIARNVGLAEDAVQETFLRYYAQRKRGDIPGERAWLFRVVRNYILDDRKSSSSRTSVGIEAAHGYPDQSRSPEQAFESSEAMRLVMEILTPRELQCLQLRTEGFSYKEIAQILSIGSGTVGALLARSSEKIRRALGEEGLPCEAL